MKSILQDALQNKRWYWHYRRYVEANEASGRNDILSQNDLDWMQSFKCRALNCLETARRMRDTHKSIMAEWPLTNPGNG